MIKKPKKKCSSKKHGEIDAINYCIECKVYMCKNCLNFHSKLQKDHHIFSINEEIEETFTGFCKEENHNILCCALCICKMKEKGYGIHKDCETYVIENIKEDKKSKLEENIKKLEELSGEYNERIKKYI